MKKNLLLILLFIASATGFAQKVSNREFNQDGVPVFVKMDKSEAYALNRAPELFKSELNMKSNDELRMVEEFVDELGYKHQRFQQFYKGIKVENGIYNVHGKEGRIETMNGDFLKIKELPTLPSLSENEALQVALSFVGAETYMWQNQGNEKWAKENEPTGTFKPYGEMVIVGKLIDANQNLMQAVVAYKFNIYAEKPLSRDYIYVDANTGEIVKVEPIIKKCNNFEHSHELGHIENHESEMEAYIPDFNSVLADATATAATRYSGTRTITTDSYNGSYRLREVLRGNGIQTFNMKKGTNYSSAVDFTDVDNNWTAAEFNNTNKDNAALDAHWGAEMTYDYFKNVHNRNSYDNAGAIIKSYVHYSSAYDNAYWNGSVMTYGDGSGTYFDALTSLDVAAHEIGHAVCEKTANLAYQNESGAMNEGFSDIWAACVEYFAEPSKQIWLIGEDIERRSGHVALRSMSDPNVEGQPDTYKGTNWVATTTNPTSSNDYGGVHTNSGVLNHWFYILSVGKTGTNDIGSSFSVTGITIDKAAKIAYRTESLYLTANSTYANARTFSIQAATELYGAESNEVIQTTNAWYAVGVGAAYGGGGTTPTDYCASKGNSVADEWIASVKVGTFTNTSTAAGYTDFTSKTVSLSPGVSTTLTLTPGYAGSAYNEYWKVWIDYNNDKDFDDAGELVFDAGSAKANAVSGSFTVSASANGTTRMRVSMKYNAAQTACETFSYGEVEDYTVSFAAPVADTQAPTAPTNLTSTNLTSTSLTLSWTASTDNVAVTGYDVYRNGSLLTSVTSTSTSVSGLTANTAYSFYVKAKDAAGNVSAASTTLNVTTPAASVTYCASKGTNATYEWIDLVQLGSMSNTSASNSGYGDFTSKVANIVVGSNTIYFSAAFKSTAYTEYWRVYIDYNKDGDFADAGETVYSGSSKSAATLSGTFTVPSTFSGSTRMRVSMKYNAAQTSSCETFSYGEVEDYTVTLSTAFAPANGIVDAEVLGNDVEAEFTMYPNPVENYFVVESRNELKTVSVFNMLGERVMEVEVNGFMTTVGVEHLTTGVYMVRTFDGQKENFTKILKK